MKDFRIAMAQINMPQINTVDQNIEKMHTWIRKAADNGADMIMFGELSVSGYLLNSSGLAADGFEMPGVSIVFSPFGEVITEGKRFAEDLLLVDLKESEIEKYRTYGHHYTLKFRRPETYDGLTRMIP